MPIFIQNKYTKWYYNIITAALIQERMPNKKQNKFYYEKHHIMPVSMNGDDVDDNKVLLTAKEHFIVHLLLMYMPKSPKHRSKMGLAFSKMKRDPQGKRFVNSKQFQLFRHKAQENMREYSPHSKQCIVDGNIYHSRSAASRDTGISHHSLTAMVKAGFDNFEKYTDYLKKRRSAITFKHNRRVIINNVHYRSISIAVTQTGLTQYAVQQIEKDQRTY